MAETLLAENSFAQKNRYQIDDNQEILAFSLGNLQQHLPAAVRINGSVSRTAMGEQYQAKTQLTGLVAGGSMIILLLFVPALSDICLIPVLTAIVISALLGATEFDLAARLWNVSMDGMFYFLGAFFGVLIFGNHQRRIDRYYVIFYRDDHTDSKTGDLFSRNPAGT